MDRRGFFTKLFGVVLLAALPKAKAAPQWEGCVQFQTQQGEKMQIAHLIRMNEREIIIELSPFNAGGNQ